MAVFLSVAAIVATTISPSKSGLIEVRADLGSEPSGAVGLAGAAGQAFARQTIVGVARGAEMANSAALTGSESASIVSTDQATAAIDPALESSFASQGAIQDSGSPVGPVFDSSGILTYTVRRGDTLSEIAAHFHQSAADIMSANPSLHKNSLRVGASIIIPNGANAVLAISASEQLPNFNADLIMPTTGYNYGILHNYNAVDIANSCGTPVVAAAEGLVIPDENIPDTLDGWNGGYGNFILLEHPFGNSVRTRYAHLEKMLVQVGDYVKQGQEIGLMGETGDATGCHLHFEVIGAQNPFAR